MVLALTMGVTAPVAAAAQPGITDLGTLPGDVASSAEDLNEAGVVIGQSFSATAPDGTRRGRAVRWSPDGTITALLVPAGIPHSTNSRPLAVNDAGYITGFTGYGPKGVYEYRALRWAPNGKVTELKPLPGDTRTFPRGISRDGTVAGESYNADGKYHAVKWALDGTVTRLSPLPGDTEARAGFINNNNMVVGYSLSRTSDSRAVRWSADGTVEDIDAYVPTPEVGNDAGVISGWGTSGHGYRLDPNGTLADLGKTAYMISVSPGGFVVGSFYISAWATTAVRWAPDGTPTTLPGLPTHNNSWARDMNAAGTVVGSTSRTEQMNFVESSAVKWSPNGTITVLAALPGSKHSQAHLINSVGTIAGSARNSAGESHAVVWRS